MQAAKDTKDHSVQPERRKKKNWKQVYCQVTIFNSTSKGFWSAVKIKSFTFMPTSSMHINVQSISPAPILTTQLTSQPKILKDHTFQPKDHTIQHLMGDVAQWLESQNSNLKTVFDRLAGQGERQFFCPSESTLVQTCLCLTPLHVYGTLPNLCAHERSHIHLS